VSETKQVLSSQKRWQGRGRNGGPVINIGTGVQLGEMYGQIGILFAPEKALFFWWISGKLCRRIETKKLKKKR